MARPARSFSRRVLRSQLTVVIVILVLVTGVFAWLGARNVTEVSENKALVTARTLASAPEVREAATKASRTHTDPPDPALTGPLQDLAEDVRTKTGTYFAVITDDRGIRLTHPNPARIGHMVSTSPDRALSGQENITREAGTLGETVRAKVPIYSTEDATSVVGEVSVGIRTSVLDAHLRREFLVLGSVAVIALAVRVISAVALGRRLRSETLGIGPEELAEMAREQGAVLRGLDDGVLGFDTDGRLTLSNSTARQMLGSPFVSGAVSGSGPVADNGDRQSHERAAAAGETEDHAAIDGTGTVDSVRVPAVIADLLAGAPKSGTLQRRITIGERILLATAVHVRRDRYSVGGVVTLRDETQMLTMARQLESVTTMAQALRTQRHEFANRLHTVLGLVDTGASEEAHDYLATILRTGAIAAPVTGIETVTDPYLGALLEAKGTIAAEAGLSLSVTPDSLVLGTVAEPEDVTLILGNLIDNAIRAVVERNTWHGGGETLAEAGSGGDSTRSGPANRGRSGPVAEDMETATAQSARGRIDVQILGAGTELSIVVTDTGVGVEDTAAERIFEKGYSSVRSGNIRWDDEPTGGENAGTNHLGEVAEHDLSGGREHGLGIGLSLCRGVAERLGGSVTLLTGHDAELGGASFALWLPEGLRDTRQNTAAEADAGADPDADFSGRPGDDAEAEKQER